nr:immunoglobulin light chain junction region [Macaca mulatta]MOX85068.1 immunoglobulin light chain junction region [Macaca mulatta]MOX85644.1 immunoglobulin light chain junction region [Macaca mulatta]MOX89118.1 immunoglobulin light chain junction region [Macaca mulatta]
CQQYNNLLLTF